MVTITGKGDHPSYTILIHIILTLRSGFDVTGNWLTAVNSANKSVEQPATEQQTKRTKQTIKQPINQSNKAAESMINQSTT